MDPRNFHFKRKSKAPSSSMQRIMSGMSTQGYRKPGGNQFAAFPCGFVAALRTLTAVILHQSLFWTCLLRAVEVKAASEGTVNDVEPPERCSSSVQIAVIGGGISGAATVAFLKKLTAQSCESCHPDGGAADGDLLLSECALRIDLFEADDHLGGRLDHVYMAGGHLEMGGENVHSSNKYMKEFIRMYEYDVEGRRRENEARNTHFFGWKWVVSNAERLVYNGEYISPFRAIFLVLIRTVMTSVVHAWSEIYNLLESGMRSPLDCCAWLRRNQAAQTKYTAFDSGFTLTSALGFTSRLYRKFSSLVQSLVLSPGRSLIEGIIISIYTQSSALQSLAGLLSLACAFGKLLQNETPRRFVVEHLIQKYADSVNLNCKIDRVIQHVNAGHKFTLESNSCGLFMREVHRRYDYVVIAAPLSPALRIFRQAEGAEAVEVYVPYYEYQEVFVTAVQAERIRQDVQLVQHFSTVVATAEHSGFIGTFFVSQCDVRDGDNERALVSCKLKSGRRLSDRDLDVFFENIYQVERRTWKAYPRLYPFSHTPPSNSPTYPPAATKFELTPGLFYVNAFEGVFSCMEGQAVAARNVAQLLMNSIGSESDETRRQQSPATEWADSPQR